MKYALSCLFFLCYFGSNRDNIDIGAGDDCVETQEVLQEQAIRHVTREYMDFLCTFSVNYNVVTVIAHFAKLLLSNVLYVLVTIIS
jgi:hypothetical protein